MVHLRFTQKTATAVSALLLLAAAVSTVGATGLAEDPLVTRPVVDMDHSQNIRLSRLVGLPVTMDGRQVAAIRDTVVDIGEGTLAYVIVEFTDDSIVEDGSLYPLPVHFFTPRSGADGLELLSDNRTYFRNVPTLEDMQTAGASSDISGWDSWIAMDANTTITVTSAEVEDRRFYLQRFRYRYSGGPQVVPSATLLGSELIGLGVRDTDGRMIGEITDSVVSLDTAQLLLVNLEPRTRIGAEGDGYLIPLPAFTGNKETTTVFYDIEELALTGPSEYTGDWPAISSGSYHQELARFWNTRHVDTRYASGMRIVPVRLTPVTYLASFGLFSQDRNAPGEIVDILIEPDATVRFAIAEIDGRRTLIPVSILTLSRVSQAAVLNVRAANLKDIPTYPAGRTVDTGEDGWDDPFVTYWNNLFEVETGDMTVGEIPTAASVQDIPDGSALPASELLGFRVVDPSGSSIGSVDQLYLDLVDGRVGFVHVEVEGTGLVNADAPIPIDALEWQPSRSRFVLDADLERLQDAPGYGELPLSPGAEFLNELQTYWGTR